MKNPGILIAAFPKWSVQVARIAAITIQKANWIMRMYVLEDFKLNHICLKSVISALFTTG